MNKLRILISIMAAGAVMWSCSSEDIPGLSDSPFEGNPYTPVELSAREAQVSDGLWPFSMSLLRNAWEENGRENTVVSPLSATMVLGMISNSVAEGDREDVLNALNLTGDLSHLNLLTQKVMENLPDADKRSKLNLGNGLWLNNSYPQIGLKEGYRSLMGDYYKSEIMTVETFDNTKTVNAINQWISDKTEGEIPTMLKEDELNTKGSGIWVNTMYFKGSWTHKFDKSKTSKQAFFREDGWEEQTDMMHGTKGFMPWDNSIETGNNDPSDQIKAVTMPYGNSSFVFTAILPPENNQSIDFLFENMSYGFVGKSKNADFVNNYNKEESSHLYIPKITASATSDLIPVLKKLGIEKIFSSVDMSESLGVSNQRIDLMKHSVKFEMDEEGATAVAATVGSGSLGAGYHVIEFNRPFVYMVWERSTGAVLLAGIYMHP